jgi:four helix bundle protein
MRNFKQLKIWQKGFDIATDTYRLTDGFPKSEKYPLAQQATSAAVSIPLNIAEGNSRQSEKDYCAIYEHNR